MPFGGSHEANALGSIKASKIARGVARIALEAESVLLPPEAPLISHPPRRNRDGSYDQPVAATPQLALMRITLAAIFSASVVGWQEKILSGRPAAHQT